MGIDALILFFPTCLTGFLFFSMALSLRDLLFSSFVLITCFFLVQIIKSLASSYKLSLLQGKSISTNSTFSLLPSKLEFLLYSTTCVDLLVLDLMDSAIIKFDYVMPKL